VFEEQKKLAVDASDLSDMFLDMWKEFEIANYNVARRKQTLSGIFHEGLIEGIVKF